MDEGKRRRRGGCEDLQRKARPEGERPTKEVDLFNRLFVPNRFALGISLGSIVMDLKIHEFGAKKSWKEKGGRNDFVWGRRFWSEIQEQSRL